MQGAKYETSHGEVPNLVGQVIGFVWTTSLSMAMNCPMALLLDRDGSSGSEKCIYFVYSSMPVVSKKIVTLKTSPSNRILHLSGG